MRPDDDIFRDVLRALDDDDPERARDLVVDALPDDDAEGREQTERLAKRADERGEPMTALWIRVNGPHASNELMTPPEIDLREFGNAIMRKTTMQRAQEREDASLIVESWRYDQMEERWKPGERICVPGRSGSYPDRSKNRFGTVIGVAPVVTVDTAVAFELPEIRVSGTLIVQMDGDPPRTINSDVVRHVRDGDDDPNARD